MSENDAQIASENGGHAPTCGSSSAPGCSDEFIRALIGKIQGLQRTTHRVYSGGDGHIDDWPEDDEYGDYVEWTRIVELLDWIKQNPTGLETVHKNTEERS